MSSWGRSPLPWLGGLLALYLVAPFGALLGRLDGKVWTGVHQAAVLSALRVSAEAASISTALIAILGIPLAYVFARGRSRLLRALELIVYVPLALPPLVSGILLLFLVGPYTALGRLFGGRLTDSLAGIVLAQTFVAAPFLVVAARSAFATVDPSLEAVAATLGRPPVARFVGVSLRLAWPGILAGMLLAWLRAFGEFGATVMLAYHPYSLPVYTYVSFGSAGLGALLAPVVVSIAAALAVVALVRAIPFLHRRRRPEVALPAPSGGPADGGGGGPRLSFALTKSYRGFTLDVGYEAQTRRLALLGASGAGKSLTLRLLAGTLRPDAEAIALGARRLDGVAPERRGVGYVPQEYALFPHLDVWRQLTFAPDADHGLARYWLDRLGLAGLQGRLPRELSGGQRQRVALGRALARTPGLLLLDEPLSALDAPVRAELRRELRALQHELAATTIVVTHDPDEAALLADELLVLEDGRLIQAGRTADVLARPASPHVARLLGIPNIHDGVAVEGGMIETDGVRIPAEPCVGPGRSLTWSVRPDAIEIDAEGPLEATVVDVAELPTLHEATLRLSPALSLIARNPRRSLRTGARCRIAIPRDAILTWAA
ncbi:MAG: ATP-binding cassette domain-containing protein [Acidobacteriota bacterium]|nr:ATP-binding cassette domain-containing protein [Acidobacteriota bacterium]MDE3191060.1 ATP-binding cassette domain-containing protein [Acidobacteriota bacterium]